MDEEIESDKFDEMLANIGSSTPDNTVQTIGRELWFFYDDLKDHSIVASKQEWDCFNRILLLLASDAEVEVVERWGGWQLSQSVAAVAVVCYIYLGFRRGFSADHLLTLALPFCVVSVALALFNRSKRAHQKSNAQVDPFPSLSELFAVRRRVGDFTRRRYPRTLADRRIRGPLATALMWIPSALGWLMFAPVILLLQILPDRNSEIRFTLGPGAPFPSD
jgi:hypothetical protein